MLRKGKTKDILESSIDSALLSVEVYNKPRSPFRIENYISLMIIAWTRLFHAYFYNTIGDKYYYKTKSGFRYKKIEGERKAWELKTCIKKYGSLEEPIIANLEFFIKIRNKIEHRHISKENIGKDIFGECQSLLYNYERILIEIFGDEYVLNENLAFSLQFSQMRTTEQKIANKKLLSRDLKNIKKFIDRYRSNLKRKIFNSQQYSIRLIQIPRILNNPKKDVPAIEFVNWSNLSFEDKENYEKVTALIKKKLVKTEVLNPGKLKAGDIVKRVSKNTSVRNFSHYDHKCLYYIFSVRPISSENVDKFKTNINYCHYDEVHDDYVYQDSWAEFVTNSINNKLLSRKSWKEYFKKAQKLDIKNYS